MLKLTYTTRTRIPQTWFFCVLLASLAFHVLRGLEAAYLQGTQSVRLHSFRGFAFVGKVWLLFLAGLLAIFHPSL